MSSVSRGKLARTGLLATVFICAACGLVYELALVALGSYLIGNTAQQASIVLGLMVFAMGAGALAAKPLQKRAAAAFALIELLLALFGGLSVIALYAAFAWLHLYTVAMVGVALLLGVLIGAEIPLLMVLLQRLRKQSAGSAVADLFAADYIGALLGGLAFPFLLLPVFGQIKGALIVGAVNALAGLILVFTLFRRDLRRRTRWIVGGFAALVAVTLVGGYAYAGRFEAEAQQALYANPIVYSEQTQYQRIVMTQSISPFRDTDTRLYLNGDLQFSSVDEYRYHEALVHPALAGDRDDVLVLGGGDGLALREILEYPDVENVTLVELDPAMTDLARDNPVLNRLNGDAFADPRVDTVNADAFNWLRGNTGRYDAIIVDMPDPDETATAKLYSVEFYGLASRLLAKDGRMAVQSGSPYFAPKSFWCVNKTLKEAGTKPVPYHVTVPSFGDWGFNLVGAKSTPELALDPPGDLKSLDGPTLDAATVFPPDRPERDVPASTLMDPVILEYAQSEWDSYG
ncbi:polyamine aminopropyltransferase [Stackebrandtia nassauensis]|uniref:Polyamine aminopropyltransferase n=1 Tax=Stackebrandtia nassauensis (strain DSM 44728 / CIP 108903 / NRRL B-16338 / NBRC 102104 / LLR-40K-21) TaxID=446470 RepID=D3Q8W8_STANL|nr:polyamine aminopropyltransferase [Stackebrandtia nassauensis]ADD40577.1 Spermine synthase [Stackebrandtia nassauensis DSM 44728]